ncbi:hypothetical protein KAW48_06340 [candidate division WOR-3 bacterium]|nr:hypothetical protein [candidate division WOR-3 bacterium]
MNIKKILIDFFITFIVTLVVSAIVSLLWNLIFHGVSIVDWGTSFRFAIIFGIVFPWMRARDHKEKEK